MFSHSWFMLTSHSICQNCHQCPPHIIKYLCYGAHDTHVNDTVTSSETLHMGSTAGSQMHDVYSAG